MKLAEDKSLTSLWKTVWISRIGFSDQWVDWGGRKDRGETTQGGVWWCWGAAGFDVSRDSR